MTVKHDVQILLILLKLIFQFCWFSLTIWVGSSFCRILRKYSNIHTTASSFGDTSVVDIKTVEVQISIPWTRNHRTVWPFTCCSPQHPSSLSSFRVVQTTRHQSPPASSSSLVMAGWHRCRACHSTDLPRLAFLSPIKRWVNDGEARRREGVMDSYSMHNNWERLSTCITPSTPSQLSHLRPAERHKHTQIFTKTQKVDCKLLSELTIKAGGKGKKIIHWCIKLQLTRGRSQRWLVATKLPTFSRTFPKKHADMNVQSHCLAGKNTQLNFYGKTLKLWLE